jgi:hypothetical protein
MSRKKVSTTIYITPEQADRLKLLHDRTKVPVAVFIREGIDMMLKHYEPVLPGQMSLDSASLSPAPPSVTLGPPRRNVGEPGRGAASSASPSGAEGGPPPPPKSRSDSDE